MAQSFRVCGKHSRVRVCNTCEAPRPGSGQVLLQDSDHQIKPCSGRTCPFCQRIRVAKVRAVLRETVERNETIPKGTSWKFITFTSVYNPRSDVDLTVKGLRERLKGLQSAVRATRKANLDVPGGGTFASVEIVGSGHLHVHMLALTHRYVSKEAIEATMKETWDRSGFVDIDDLAGNPQRVIHEVAKYCAKSAGPMAEDWLAGEPRETMDPVLCARFEVAALNLRMNERTGIFRGVEPPPPEAAELEHFDFAVGCLDCGTVGEWHWSTRSTRAWARHCHRQGFPAFSGSRWWVPDEEWAQSQKIE
jgi:hypothetical protein